VKFVSIDIETTGLNPVTDQILHIAAVVEDTSIDPLPSITDLPFFERIIDPGRIDGDAFALAMNHDLICALRDVHGDYTVYRDRKIEVKEVGAWWGGFYHWLFHHFGDPTKRPLRFPKKIAVAGKNAAGFDLPFIYNNLRDGNPGIFHHRVIDPGSVIMGARPELWDELEQLPGLSDVVSSEVTHDALDDARAVVEALRVLRGAQ